MHRSFDVANHVPEFDVNQHVNSKGELTAKRGALVSCAASYLNASRIKGRHAAIKTGMLAAEATFDAIVAGLQHPELSADPKAFENSWLYIEFNKAGNFKQWFKKGRSLGRVDIQKM